MGISSEICCDMLVKLSSISENLLKLSIYLDSSIFNVFDNVLRHLVLVQYYVVIVEDASWGLVVNGIRDAASH